VQNLPGGGGIPLYTCIRKSSVITTVRSPETTKRLGFYQDRSRRSVTTTTRNRRHVEKSWLGAPRAEEENDQPSVCSAAYVGGQSFEARGQYLSVLKGWEGTMALRTNKGERDASENSEQCGGRKNNRMPIGAGRSNGVMGSRQRKFVDDKKKKGPAGRYGLSGCGIALA